MIHFTCLHCGAKMTAYENRAGVKSVCLNCRHPIVVPSRIKKPVQHTVTSTKLRLITSLREYIKAPGTVMAYAVLAACIVAVFFPCGGIPILIGLLAFVFSGLPVRLWNTYVAKCPHCGGQITTLKTEGGIQCRGCKQGLRIADGRLWPLSSPMQVGKLSSPIQASDSPQWVSDEDFID